MNILQDKNAKGTRFMRELQHESYETKQNI